MWRNCFRVLPRANIQPTSKIVFGNRTSQDWWHPAGVKLLSTSIIPDQTCLIASENHSPKAIRHENSDFWSNSESRRARGSFMIRLLITRQASDRNQISSGCQLGQLSFWGTASVASRHRQVQFPVARQFGTGRPDPERGINRLRRFAQSLSNASRIRMAD
jgi:hypothetical protein